MFIELDINYERVTHINSIQLGLRNIISRHFISHNIASKENVTVLLLCMKKTGFMNRKNMLKPSKQCWSKL